MLTSVIHSDFDDVTGRGRTLGSDHLVRRGTGNGTGAGSNAGGSSNSATPGSGRRGGGVNGDNGDGATGTSILVLRVYRRIIDTRLFVEK